MVKYISAILILGLGFSLQAQYRCQDIKSSYFIAQNEDAFSINNNGKSDTIDILHYDLNLDLFRISSRQLSGNCKITFVPKVADVHSIEIDLLKFNIDSVILNDQVLNYSYNDTILSIDLGNTYSPSDTLILNIGYHGSPQGDATGWGGFHFQNGYYYNLGVGFGADPHTYGRAWFPCFDNFVEKSTYHFTVLTENPNKAYCNGLRTDIQQNGDSIISRWNMTDEIPTYLASIAVSNYEELKDTIEGKEKILPIELMAKSGDTANLRKSFVNLKTVTHSLENRFGPYQWQKIGYAATTVGAMEHATSIHFPIQLIDGTLSGEDIMAHELAHHWWGNLLTCETDKDMWINEGMAEYCSHLYEEDVYGRQRYLNTVKANAYSVLNEAHKRDQAYRPVYGLTHPYVYGMHVYQKGAMVAHNLRAYLGDDLFFTGLTSLLNNNAYGNINTSDFRDQLSQITGISLDDFFNDWIFHPGYASFAVDSSFYENKKAFVKVSQNTRKAPELFQNVPVDITFFSEKGDTANRIISCSGTYSQAIFEDLPFTPLFAMASYRGQLISGDTYDESIIRKTGPDFVNRSKMILNTESITDSARIIRMHHWAGPVDQFVDGKDFRISKNHYWTVRGLDMEKADITGRIDYNFVASDLDHDLLENGADSLLVLYRAHPWEKWEVYEDQKKVILVTASKVGYIELGHLKAGNYVLANSGEKTDIEETPEMKKGSIDIYPNPARSKLHIDFHHAPQQSYSIRINDISGKLLYSRDLPESPADSLNIDVSTFKSGIILVHINNNTYKVSLDK